MPGATDELRVAKMLIVAVVLLAGTYFGLLYLAASR